MPETEHRAVDPSAIPQATTFADVGELLRSRELEPLPREAARDLLGSALVSLHGGEHRRRRSKESPLFSLDALRRYEHEVLESALGAAFDDLIETADGDGRARLNLPEFATELILNISMVLIGFDRREPEDRRFVLDCIEPLIAAHEIEWRDGDPHDVIDRAAATKTSLWNDYLAPAYQRRREAIAAGREWSPPDLLSVLAANSDDIDEDTVAQECALYLVASVLTTSATITDTVDQLLSWCSAHPDDRSSILDESSDFLRCAVDESLRLNPPIKPLLLRVASTETTVGGCPYEHGAVVGANTAAAHNDPDVYPDSPEEFNPRRSPASQVRRSHYSFGEGPHLCIGRPLVIGNPRAGTQGDAPTIVRALFAADVRFDQTREPRLAPSARKRYIDYPVTVRVR